MKTKILYSGRSMIEMLGVLAIMGIITGMSIAAYNMAMGTLKSGRTTEDITKIQQSVRSLYPDGVYKDIKTKTFVDLGVVPALSDKPELGRNQYGGSYEIKSADGDLSFAIILTKVPKNDCITFVTAKQPGVIGMGISNGDTVDPNSDPEKDKATLTSACTQNDVLTIGFKYR